MGTETEPLDLLERALDQTAVIIAAIQPEQAGLPTPCPGWNVQSLVQHLTAQDLRNFAVAARGETPEWQAPPDDLGEDWARAFRDGAQQLLQTWRAADLNQLVTMPGAPPAPLRSRLDQQITELTVHDWDLVRATGLTIDLNPDLAEHALGWAQQALRPEFRGPDKSVGLEVSVGEDSPVYDRLAGWFGRDPRWTPDPEARPG